MQPAMTQAELLARLERLEDENTRLKAAKLAREPRLSMKVSEKGALSVYGLGRFPVTLYKTQWVKLLGLVGEIKQFMEENSALLTEKD